jgi:F-type H+-transporting ATPase subunit b
MDLISLDINVRTLVVQLLATLVLFFVAAKFFVGPMKKFLAERAALIAADFAAAEGAKEEAEQARVEAQTNVKVAKESAYQIIEAAKSEAEVKHEAILEQARIDAEVELKNAHEEITRERQNMYNEAKKEIASIATNATAKLIKKEIDAKIHDQLFDEFVELVGGHHE